MLPITKSFGTWLVALFVGLELSVATSAFAAAARSLEGNCVGGMSLQERRLRNLPEDASPEQSEARTDLVIVEAPEMRAGLLSDRFRRGSRLVRLTPSGASPTCLTSDFFAATDPRISFDGSLVLFAGKKTADSHWQIWEMSATGLGARQVTHCSGDCLKPAYLPRDEIVYTALLPAPGGEADRGPAARGAVPPASDAANRPSVTSQLWVSKVDGSNAHPITFGPGDFQVETVLRNGMILATARSPLLPSNGLPADRQLYTLRPDGTGLATLRCDHQHPAIRSQATELEDGAVVFVKWPLGSRSLEGDLAWIRRGALHNAPLTSAPTLALSPQPIGENELLAARQSPAGLPARPKLSLYLFDAELGRFTRTIYQDSKLSVVEGVPVAAHEPPRWYWSTLNPDLHRGYFVCLNVYLADGVPRGRIASKLTRVRVLTFNTVTQRESVLGEAPVQADGSFYLAVPSDEPVRFEVLDDAGRVVRAQRSWIWSRSGEEHGCVGCHEDRALAPENRWPMALRRFDTPTLLGVKKQ